MTVILLLLLPVFQQIPHLPKLHDRPVIPRFRIIQRNIDNQHDPLTEVIEGDDLVKEHQIHILESLRIFRCASCGGLTVIDVIVGEISYKPARKTWEIIQPRTPVIRQDLPQIRRRILCSEPDIPCLHLAVHAGDLHLRLISQESVAAPGLILRRRFQHIYVSRNILQDPQRLHGRDKI